MIHTSLNFVSKSCKQKKPVCGLVLFERKK